MIVCSALISKVSSFTINGEFKQLHENLINKYKI